MGIRLKVVLLVLGISLAAFIGFAVFVFNASTMRQMYHDLTREHAQTVVQKELLGFNSFLNTIEAASGVSPALGEVYYKLRNSVPREELQTQMAASFKIALAREPNLVGGGAFYEPNLFYPEQFDFHLYVSKSDPRISNPDQVNAEWTWDVKTYEEGWYQSAIPRGWNRSIPRDQRHYWSELYVDTSINVLMVSVCQPMYDSNRTIIGVGTVDVSLDTLQKMVTSFQKPTPSAQIAAFSTLNKATFATNDSGATGINPYESGSWHQQLANLSPGQSLSNDKLELNGQIYTLYASVHNSGIGFAILIPNEEMYQTVDALQQSNMLTAILVCVAMIIISIGVIMAFRKWLMRPLGHLTEYASAVEGGNLDSQLRGEFQDEMGVLSRAILNMVQFLKHEMQNAADKSQHATEMATVAEEAKQKAEESLKAETERRDQIMLATQQLSQVAGQLHAVSQAISSETDDIRQGSEAQHRQLQGVVNAMDEMRSSVMGVANSAEQAADAAQKSKLEAENGAKVVSGNAKALQDIRNQAEVLMGRMRTLGDKSNAIGSIMTMIDDIADQTNLLALNAAIEAARAGDAGRGFAVVADEVRKLAEKTMSATGEVAEAVKAIQIVTEENTTSMQKTMDSISRASEMAEESNRGLHTIVSIAQTTANEVHQITTASEVQSSAVREIGSSVEQVFNIATRTSSQVENTVAALGEMLSQIEQLQQIMSSLKK